MPLERVSGRVCGANLGFPASCAAYSNSALLPCAAELRGRQCLVCIRKGDIPPPADWYGPGWSIVGVESVQIVRADRVWQVVCFFPQRWVNPSFPVIACRAKTDAIAYAHMRAEQLRPGKRIVAQRGEPDTWKCGDLVIWVAPNA